MINTIGPVLGPGSLQGMSTQVTSWLDRLVKPVYYLMGTDSLRLGLAYID